MARAGGASPHNSSTSRSRETTRFRLVSSTARTARCLRPPTSRVTPPTDTSRGPSIPYCMSRPAESVDDANHPNWRHQPVKMPGSCRQFAFVGQMATWIRSSTSGQSATARAAESTRDNESRWLRKPWLAATIMPTTTQTTTPSDTWRRITALAGGTGDETGQAPEGDVTAGLAQRVGVESVGQVDERDARRRIGPGQLPAGAGVAEGAGRHGAAEATFARAPVVAGQDQPEAAVGGNA